MLARLPSNAGDLIAASRIAAPEARSLLACALGVARESLIAQPQRDVGPAPASHFRDLCARRLAGEPMAYLLGQREFFGRQFRVDRSVLIPRPETECLVDQALQVLTGLTGPSLVDLGTGSGRSSANVTATHPEPVPGASPSRWRSSGRNRFPGPPGSVQSGRSAPAVPGPPGTQFRAWESAPSGPPGTGVRKTHAVRAGKPSVHPPGALRTNRENAMRALARRHAA